MTVPLQCRKYLVISPELIVRQRVAADIIGQQYAAARNLIFSVAFAVKQAIVDLERVFRALELDL